ncbi:hypothetical protein IE53DRAFT_51456 [Violaceomyces palustris]|uniref:Uncharacterized protein n=1 Tax=Violaceomyces palustris TaxID=1673888 RepID=A0ACD0NZZ2_9BASI|nr:hypothetical protein IE53DRAFT_51456 [Violaceomyces palustris]
MKVIADFLFRSTPFRHYNHVQALEEQNAELVDRNAALEDEYKRVSAFKPLMDSYKSQISELESKASNLQRDLNTSRYDHEQTMSRLRASEDSRTKEKEEMELYQERIQELELGGPASSKRKKALPGNGSDGAESLAAADEGMSSSTEDLEDIGGELDDAITGTTMTDLKIKVRKLARELEAAKTNKADSSKILVLENLLDDAQRMKSRYEADYLREHKEKLVLQRELENIRSGKSGFGDGAEAAFALRVRLNEVVEELDRTKREFAALQVQTEHMTKDLTIAKSDLLLVNKDQVDILHSLRASVDVEKNELEAALKKVRLELGKAEEQNRMYMAQVNSLLMEKVDLQTEGIGQREEALRRERNLGELRASLAGKALPKEAEEMIANLQASTLSSEAQLKALQEKFQKAKLFIKQQDKMIKERDRNPTLASPTVVSGVGVTDEEVEKENKKLKEDVDILLREQRLMASAYHSLGLRYARELDTNGRSPGSGPAVAGRASYRAAGFATANGGPSSASWLGQQRRMVASGLTLTGK